MQTSQVGAALVDGNAVRDTVGANGTLAEPLASKCWSRRTDKNFTDFAKNRVFQQYQPKVLNDAWCLNGSGAKGGHCKIANSDQSIAFGPPSVLSDKADPVLCQ